MAGKSDTANDLRERVTIQHATVERDDFGGELLTWQDGLTVWARVTERGGREPLLADRLVMVVSYEVTIRSGVSVTHHNRLAWRGKVLGVEVVTPKQAAGLMVLRCLEVELQADSAAVGRMAFDYADNSGALGAV
jgi:SPP1 family predicted phage head-tail adaptor